MSQWRSKNLINLDPQRPGEWDIRHMQSAGRRGDSGCFDRLKWVLLSTGQRDVLDQAMGRSQDKVVWHIVCVEASGVVCDRLFFEQAGFWIVSLG